MRTRTLLAAAALTAGLAFAGSAEAAPVAPIKIQWDAAKAGWSSTLVSGENQLRRPSWRHERRSYRKYKRHKRHARRYHRRHYYYDPDYYDFFYDDYGWYDDYPRYRPGIRLYFGF